PALPLLGLAALGCSGWVVVSLGLLTAMGYLTIACFGTSAILVGDSFWLEHPLEQVVLGTVGLLVFTVVLAAGSILLFGGPGGVSSPCESDDEDDEGGSPTEADAPRSPEDARSPIALVRRNLDWFLLIWFVMELGAYVALSPFPAARRVMSLAIVS